MDKGEDGSCRLSRFASGSDRSSRDRKREMVMSQNRTKSKMEKRGTTSSQRLTRKRSFRKLPGFGS